MTDMPTSPRPGKGLLFIWTDIEPVHEEEFNRWYDREHMAERAAIPGFELSRRFVSQDSSPKYLALYRTTSLDVFRSEVYRNAFANQTQWSNQTFARMKNTVRRVGEIADRAGQGEGGFLSLFLMPRDRAAPAHATLDAVTRADGVITAWVMEPDAALSVPIGAPSGEPVDDRIIVVEGTDPGRVAACTRHLAEACLPGGAHVVSFHHLWSLSASFT